MQVPLTTLNQQVEHCLAVHPKSRDSDWILYYWVIKEFYVTDFERPLSTIEDFVSVLRQYPRMDEISRARRAVVQSYDYKRYLPLSWEVAQQRKIKELAWRNYIESEALDKSDQQSWLENSPPGYNSEGVYTGTNGAYAEPKESSNEQD